MSSAKFILKFNFQLFILITEGEINMAKKTEAAKNAEITETTEAEKPVIDSKYRMIIVAAQRSKQLQRGATPRVDIESQKHKPTRIAVMEVQQGKVGFEIIEKP